ETVRLRYFNVFGPRQTPDSPYAAVIPLFLKAMTEGRSPLIHGDGEQSRDFTFVADAVQANLRAAEAPGVGGRGYNGACGRRTSLLDLVGHLNALLGTSIAPTFGPARPGDVRHSQADVERAKAELGYRPTTDVRTGLRKCLEWWLQRYGKAERRSAVVAGRVAAPRRNGVPERLCEASLTGVGRGGDKQGGTDPLGPRPRPPSPRCSGPRGPPAARLRASEPRPKQLDRAEAVPDALAGRHHFMVEAGTGVGKSFSYLVPAMLAAAADKDCRVVVSTHTIALQEQLVTKDIPFLQGVFPQPVNAVLVKGRSNYLSLRRLRGAQQRAGMLFAEMSTQQQLVQVGRWSRQTTDGSRSDLPFQPLPALWDPLQIPTGNSP